jgi:hypothetical protein
MNSTNGQVCQAPTCTATDLCRAHIVPQGFARALSGPGGHNRAVRADGSKPANQPNGPFDTAILCAPCDRRLGTYDEYAIAFCAGLQPGRSEPTGRLFIHDTFDGERFARAMLAILWRASISQRNEWAGIALGPHEDRAADLLFCNTPMAGQHLFEFALLRYASVELDTRKFVFLPIRIRSGAINMYALGVGGFLVLAKVDQRPFHAPMQRFVINGARRLESAYLRFEETGEFALFRDAAAQERLRQGLVR